jgi:RND superfamily putative drug exporter
MATLLYRLGRTAYRRWPVFVAGWLLALIGGGLIATGIAKPMVDTFSIPGIPSLQAQETQQKLFPDTPNAEDIASATVVVAAPDGHTLDEPKYAAAVDELIAELEELPQMPADPALVDPVQAADAQFEQAVQAAVESGTPREVAEDNARALLPLSDDGRIGTITWSFDVASVADVEPATQDAVLEVLDHARADGLTAEVNGSGMQQMPEGASSELIGIGVAAVILVITFGSLVAAGLPILSALVGVGLGMLGITAATAFTTIGTSTPMLATMIGLAVGIDYTLFILSRYRTELHHTDDRREAIGRAVGTAG